MVCRCTQCNQYYSFRNSRGNKLEYHKCPACGGGYQMLAYEGQVPVADLVLPEGIIADDWEGFKTVHPYVNRKGERFVKNKGENFFRALPQDFGRT